MVECHCFTTNCKVFGRELTNLVCVSDPITTRFNGVDLPDIVPTQYSALWDTGATNTCITSKVAQECNLKPIDRQIVYTPSGQHEANVYIIDLWLPNNIMISGLKVTEGFLSGNYELLIGMDVISQGDFAVSNFNNETTFSFRVPSVAKTDYVSHLRSMQPIHTEKVGRNDPCPCGSAKIYKKCCGKNK